MVWMLLEQLVVQCLWCVIQSPPTSWVGYLVLLIALSWVCVVSYLVPPTVLSSAVPTQSKPLYHLYIGHVHILVLRSDKQLVSGLGEDTSIAGLSSLVWGQRSH